MKRTQNTQGVTFRYDMNSSSIKCQQLNDKKRFTLPYGNTSMDVLETILHFLESNKEVESFSLVVNNTAKIKGYLFSVSPKGSSFISF